MKHRRIPSRLWIVAVMTVILFGVHATAHAVVSVDVSSTFVYVATNGGGGGYEAFPDVTRLSDGRLMTVFYEGYTHISPPNSSYPKGGRIMYATSANEGTSWSAPATLYDGPLDDRDPSITQLPGGGPLLCTFFTYADGAIQGSYLVKSDTAGATWSAPQSLAPAPYAVSSPIRWVSTDRLVAPIYYEGGGAAHGAVALSSNGGDAWTAPIDIPNPSKAYLDAETNVIQLNNDDLYAIQRSSHSPAQSSISDDGGQSWSDSQSLGFVAHSPYLLRTEHENLILLAYRGYNTLDGSGTGFTALRYSLDECATWSNPILVDTTVGAYPSMVNLNDGSVLVTYYEEGGSSNIRSRVITITGAPEPNSLVLLAMGLAASLVILGRRTAHERMR